MSNKFSERLKELWEKISRDAAEQRSGIDREKVVVFIISIFLAFCLWLIVNLNRDFSLDISLPVEVGNITTDQALAEELPDEVTASVNGTGWNLINLYNDPPHVFIDVTGQEVNLFEQVRRQMSGVSNVTVQKVEPLYLQVNLEPKQAKRVPVVSNVDVSFAPQYGFLGEPVIRPDSITVRGAASRIQPITKWPTDSLSFENVKESFTTEVDLKDSGSLITLSESTVEYQAEVAQFTEGEVTVPVQTRNFPAGDVVSFSPSNVTVKYRIPLQQYAEVQDQPFVAYVNYAQIQQDTSGFVKPHIEVVQDQQLNLKIQSVRPNEIAYFTIIDN